MKVSESKVVVVNIWQPFLEAIISRIIEIVEIAVSCCI